MSKYTILTFYENVLMYIEDLLGSGQTDNIQLDKLGFYLFGKNKYLGTFSSDEFPKNIKRGQCFIINNKSSRSLGEHFISVYKEESDGKLYGYDSFNRPIKSLSKYWIHKNIINATTHRDQSFLEYNCGSRSLAFLICMSKWGERVIGVI